MMVMSESTWLVDGGGCYSYFLGSTYRDPISTLTNKEISDGFSKI